MNRKSVMFILVFIIMSIFSHSLAIQFDRVHFLEQGSIFQYDAAYKNLGLHVFCYNGKPKYIIHIWQSVILQINHPSDDYSQYEGANPDAVEKEYLEKRHSWSLNLFSLAKQKNIKFNPFNTSCIGIDSREKYSVHLNIIRIDLWKLLFLVTGVLAFLSADKLSNNTAFHYICGVTFGISASFLVLIYFVSKIFPRKPFMYGILGCGWTVVIYILQILWDNIRTIMSGYRSYVIWYIIVTGLISLILCYRWGPVENQRTKNLIKWTLQLLGLISIYNSSYYQEAAMGQIIILILSYNLPERWVSAPKSYWKKKFPPKVLLLSNDEYYQQGVKETTKALEELRQFCSSPKCNQWNTALKIKDVKRFASFIEGNSHLSDEEILEYETSVQGELTDDEHSDAFTEEEEEDC